MSTTIDNNVVEMRFNNAQFESGVKSTIKSLGDLKKSLEFDSAGSAASLKNIEAGVNGISGKFTALNEVARAVITNITGMVMNLGSRMLNDLAIAPITDGFKEYELKMGSIQTIMANTRRHGTSLETVNDEFKKLNEYSDKTIYNFGDMTKNAALFTNTGMKIEDATAMIKGFSNEAAASGTSSQGAANAAYQLSQALNAGTVRLMDWKSLSNVGMGNKNMQDGLIQVADAMGMVGKKTGTTAESISKDFNGSLEKGWLSADVMSKYLKIMTNDYSVAEIQAMGFTQVQAEGFKAQAEMAEKAAKEVRTFTQLVGTIREGIASGWAETMELLIGDFTEATVLWTSVNDALGPMIKGLAEQRNNMIKEWAAAGGRTNLFAGLENIFSGLLSVTKAVGEAFGEIFPPMTGQRLADITKGFKEFTERLKPGEAALNNIKRTFKGLFAIFSIVGTILKPVLGVIGQYFDFLYIGTEKAGGGLFAFLAVIGDYIVGVDKMLKSTDVIGKAFTQLLTIFTTGDFTSGPFSEDSVIVGGAFALLEAFEAVKSGYGQLLGVITTGDFKSGALSEDSPIVDVAFKIRDVIVQVMDKLAEFQEALGNITGWNALVSAADQAWSILSKGDFIGGTWAEDSIMVDVLFQIRDGIMAVVSAAQQAWSILSTGDFIGGAFSEDDAAVVYLFKIRDAIVAVIDAVKNFNLDQVKTAFSGLADTVGEALGKLNFTQVKSDLTGLGTDIKVGIADSIASIDTGSIGANVDKIGASIGPMFRNLGTSIKDWLVPAIQNMGVVAGENFGKLGVAMKNGLKAAFTFSKETAFPALKAAAIAVGAAIGQFAKFISDKLGKIDLGEVFAKISTGLQTAATGGILVIIGKLIWELSGFVKEAKSLFGIKELLGDVGKAITSFGDDSKGVDVGAILKVAVALAILAVALFVIASIPQEELKKSLISLGIMMAALGVFSIVMSYAVRSDKLIAVAASLLLFSAAILILSSALKNMADVKWGDIGKLAVTMLLLSGVANMLSSQEKSFVKGAFSLILFAVALRFMISAVAVLGEMDENTLKKGLVSMALLMTMISVFLTVTGGGLDKKGIKALPLLAGAIKALADVVKMLGSLDERTILKGTLTLGSIFLMISMFSASMELTGDPIATGVGLMAIAAGITILAFALKMMGNLSLEEIGKGLGTLAVTLLILAVAMKSMSGLKMGGAGVQLLALAAGMVLMALALKMMGSMSLEEIGKGLLTLAGTMFIMAVAMRAMPKDLTGTASIIGIAFALGLLVPTLKAFGQMKMGEIGSSLLMLAGLFVVLAVGGRMVAGAIPGLMALAGAIAVLGLGAMLAGAGMLMFATGLASLAVGGVAGAAALVTIVTMLVGLIPMIVLQLGLGLIALVAMIAANSALIVAALVAIAIALLKGLEVLFPILITTVLNLLTMLLTAIRDRLPEIMQLGFDIIIALLTGIANNIEAVVVMALTIVANFLNGIAAKIDDVVAAGVNILIAILNGIAQRVGDLVGAAANIIIAFINGITNKLPDILRAGTNLIIAFVKGIADSAVKIATAAMDTIIEFNNGLASAIRERSEDFRKSGINIASAIVSGLTGGLNDKVADAARAAADLANRVFQAAKNALGIKSPSKKFFALGGWSVEGLANGLKDNAGTASTAASNMATSVLSAFSKTFGNLSDAVNTNLDMNPTIRPVLDLTDIQNGAKLVNGLLVPPSLDIASGYARAASSSFGASRVIVPEVASTQASPGLIYNQYNSSPKALSRVEIYRQTQNQLSQLALRGV